MEPETNDRNSMYRLIVGQLFHDGHNQLALDLSNSIGIKSPPPPSDKLFRLVAAARQVADDTDEEEKDSDMQMSLNPIVPSIDSLTTDGEYGDYFPILALPKHLLDLVFSSLSIEDRFALACAHIELNKIEKESKYYVDTLAIVEIPFIGAPLSPENVCVFKNYEHSIVIFENKSYSSDFIRRIAHNASIGHLWIELSGSSDFHREVCNLVKEIDLGKLGLHFKNQELKKEMMVESFVLDLTRSCKYLLFNLVHATPETIHELYKIMLDGSAKLRVLCSLVELEECFAFLQLIGITYRDGRFFSNGDIEIYKDESDDDDTDDEEEEQEEEDLMKGRWHIFDGHLEMILDRGNFRICVTFALIYHETRESLEEAKNEEGMKKIHIRHE